MGQKFDIFGIHVGITPLDQSPIVIRQLIDTNTTSYVCSVNVHVLVTAVRDHRFQRIINGADWSFPDGIPLVWYARHRLGLLQTERIAGANLMIKCFDELRDVKHFFYGATDSTLENLVSNARKKYPDLNIAGYFSPPFRPLTFKERQKVIAKINGISPDIIWVSLGAPKQETWMWEMRNEIEHGVMIGVGAAFDYFVGNIKRPPAWVRRSGFEWLCRLYQEPARLSKRYFVTNSLFILFLIKELLFSRRSQTKQRLTR